MKKIIIASCAAMAIIFASCSTFRPVQQHKSNFVYVITKPVNIDSISIIEDKMYHIEGYICKQSPYLTPILVWVRGIELKKVLQIPWPKEGIRMDQPFYGYAFSADDMGEKSYMTKNQVNGGEYTTDEKEQLMKDRKTQKYMIRNVLPILVSVKITGENVVLVKDVSTTQQPLTTNGPSIGNQGNQQKNQQSKNLIIDHTQDQ